jgi:hypothetical protein
MCFAFTLLLLVELASEPVRPSVDSQACLTGVMLAARPGERTRQVGGMHGVFGMSVVMRQQGHFCTDVHCRGAHVGRGRGWGLP